MKSQRFRGVFQATDEPQTGEQYDQSRREAAQARQDADACLLNPYPGEECCFSCGKPLARGVAPLPADVPTPHCDALAALRYLMGQFDSENWNCGQCGHSEPTADMDSAIWLRDWLANAQPVVTAVNAYDGGAEVAALRARVEVLEAALRVARDCPYCGVEVDAALGAA
jgi:predicted RNA-binding Zn-ribbon protein involved in translation (DUF1610 family)